YKALSNAGTWFIGRLQTEQDRNRVRDGLLAAAPTEGLDPKSLDATLASLGKRTFLLHNVHEKEPVLMQTRWAMSYLRGPLTREDIKKLVDPAGLAPSAARSATPTTAPAATPAPPRARPTPTTGANRPVLPPSVPVTFLAVRVGTPGAGTLRYEPRLLGTARVAYASAKYGVDVKRDLALVLEPGSGPVDWGQAEPLTPDVANLGREPESGLAFAELPPEFADPRTTKAALEQFRTWLRTEQPLTIRRSATLKALSQPDESEGAFRARLLLLAREARDQSTASMRQKYAVKFTGLQERLRRAEQAVQREQEQATGSKIDAAVSVGTAVLGALFGRKVISSASAGRVSSAMRKAGNVQRQSGDVERATETVASLHAQLVELETQVQADVAALESRFDTQTEPLEEISLRPRASDVTVQFCGVAWLPFSEDNQGNLWPAWG
ncbi:MAG: ATP-binding protein, partial [Gammaproteobacteria bacterium]